MTKGEVDALDLAAMPLFLIAGLFSLGIVTGVSVYGFNPADPLVTLGPSTEISAADVTSIAVLGVVLYTNDVSLDLQGGLQAWVILMTAVLVLSTPFVPVVEHYTASNIAAGMAGLALATSGYTFASIAG